MPVAKDEVDENMAAYSTIRERQLVEVRICHSLKHVVQVHAVTYSILDATPIWVILFQ
jgi:hypothetical protein